MQVTSVDERRLTNEAVGASFVLFIYEGGDESTGSSWSVDSRMFTDGDLPRVLHWMASNLPPGACWSLGVVRRLEPPAAHRDLDVAWIVGADVLNISPRDRSPAQVRLAREMVDRRQNVDLS